MSDRPAIVIILAAQRAGVVNPLAERAGVSHKCLAPICGKPLIEWVLDTVTSRSNLSEIRISIEPEAQAEVGKLLGRYADCGTKILFVDSHHGIVDSVTAAAKDDEGPFVITTADNVLLSEDGFEQVRSTMARADATLALARAEDVRTAHPEGQRNFYEFRDGGYANCNIYGLANRKAFAAAEAFREGGQFQKNRDRMIRAFGLFNIALMGLKLVSAPSAIRRVGKRFGITMEATFFADGALAIDVDNERTYAVCEELLPSRKPLPSA
ncbi:NTP transferase domain-containing protein [Parerythrobacter lacustris]|uniref:NTP transferase domain-containing protein n=1 Tax=Parerythrobacter lacustris TaxID=2969984 RepID=A0ABT1XRY8_9SPHN|nr:NTP transferase domain-containing protein [Parerythrobacter lacustris]MCR2833701.1 NTP transferase domain-containing protein [Parerythrobacter lacustris]